MNSVNILPAMSAWFVSYRFPLFVLGLLAVCWSSLPGTCLAQSEREWTDSTGKFKITASLVEVRDKVAFLKTADGKTMKIPVERLSQADQKFLQGGVNPFEMVEGAMEDSNDSTTPPPSNGNAAAAGGPWSGNYSVDWNRVPELDPGFGTEWTYQPPGSNALPFEAKRAALPGKKNFFEGMRRLEINPVAKRAVAGYTISFSVPKHLSRVSLIDLPSGKAINSETVEGCNMCPLAVLNDGNTILMQGTGDERSGYETADQLQLWRLRNSKVVRSPIWVPFPDDSSSFGKTTNGAVGLCLPIDDKRILLKTRGGHLACFDVVTREPIWHVRLARDHAMDLTVDQSTLFIMNGHTLLVVDPKTGDVTSSLTLEDKPHMGWPRVRLSPTGDQLLLSFNSELRLIDLATGSVDQVHEATGQGPIAPNGLLFPAPDYALLNNNLLFHLPSQILVCDYQQAAVIDSVGGVEFVGIMGDKNGLVVPTQMPHPRAEELLDQAENDPSLFLIHPGVEVSLDTSSVNGQYRNEIETGLRAAAEKAGYRVVNNAPIQLRANISGPNQKAVSYIASGSYIANEYTSSVQLVANNKPVWSRQGTNIPGIIQTRRDQSIQDKLNELGRQPNLGFFKGIAFPKLMQAPKEGQNQNGANALLKSVFTVSGLEDAE